MCVTAIAAGIGAVGSAVSAKSANKAANKAANTQAAAATEAAQIQADSADRALDFQRDVYSDQRDLASPTTVAAARAQAQQMIMAGLSPAEAKAYYDQTVAAIRQGGAGAGPAPDSDEGVLQSLYDAQSPEYKRVVDFALKNPNSPYFGKTALDFLRADMADNPADMDTFNRLKTVAKTQSDQAAASAYPELSLEDLSKPFESTDPGYQFRFDEGQKAVERSAAAKGKFFSGALGKGLTRYAQGVATDEFGKSFDRLGALSGRSGMGTITNAGTNFANNASDLTVGAGAATAGGVRGAGEARASGYTNTTNPFAAGLGGAFGGALSAWQSGAWRTPATAGATPQPGGAGWFNLRG